MNSSNLKGKIKKQSRTQYSKALEGRDHMNVHEVKGQVIILIDKKKDGKLSIYNKNLILYKYKSNNILSYMITFAFIY